jgi:hypothetical protein
VSRAKVTSATIRGVKGEGHARLVVSGEIDEGTTQRLRNVFGIHPTRRYVEQSGDRQKRNVGQVLGIVWLAWFFSRLGR